MASRNAYKYAKRAAAISVPGVYVASKLVKRESDYKVVRNEERIAPMGGKVKPVPDSIRKHGGIPKNSCSPFEVNDFKTLQIEDAKTWEPIQLEQANKKLAKKAWEYHDAEEFPEVDWRPLPTMTLADVKSHVEKFPHDLWLTYRGGIFDVTSFAECHPGGAGRIEMVAGGDLEAYWGVYELHNRPHIQNLIQHYRIGNLSDEESEKATKSSVFDNYYDQDPDRSTAMKEGVRVASIHPWNHEPTRPKLVDSFLTPNELFFVRNHNNVPDIETDDWALEVTANPDVGMKEDKHFTLNDLKTKFPRHEVVATLQCAGNRQEDYVTKDKPLYVAPHWTGGAIGTAVWAGVKVRDLLRECGLPVDDIALAKVNMPHARIVNFVGADMDETGTCYAGVIPVEKATDPWGDAVLVYEMNGETLPRDHGYPLRLIAPGHAGCRNVKWINNIFVSEKPSELDSGSKLDRHFEPGVEFMSDLRFNKERLDLGPVIQTMPITSIVCEPAKGQKLKWRKGEPIKVKGVAYAGGGRGVCRVEAAIDGGKNFKGCEMWGYRNPTMPEMGQGRQWTWVQWEVNIEPTKEQIAQLEAGKEVSLEVVCKAIDGDFNTQPEAMPTSYNSLGVCINHWDRVPIILTP